MACRQPEQASMQPRARGHNTSWWELALSRLMDLLGGGGTMPGLDVGADLKDLSFPAMALCESRVIADRAL